LSNEEGVEDKGPPEITKKRRKSEKKEEHKREPTPTTKDKKGKNNKRKEAPKNTKTKAQKIQVLFFTVLKLSRNCPCFQW
jgi:hypothetical protein